MKSLFKNLSQDNKELIIRLIYCTVLSTLFSWLVGEPYSPTTAVTANLFLCTDRGYRGSLRYGTRRVLVQIIQGLFCMVFIFPCKYFNLPVPDVVVIIVSCVFAIVIGLPLNMKYTYTPVLSTLANTTFIIACGTTQTFTKFPYRILECIGGYAIGYVVYYFLRPPQDRYPKTMKQLKVCSEIILENGAGPAYVKAKNSLDTDLQFLTEDSEAGLKKHRVKKNDLHILNAITKILEAIVTYQDHLNHYKPEIDPAYLEQYHLEFEATRVYYMKLLQSFIDTNEIPPELRQEAPAPSILKPSGDGELLLASDILDFRERLQTLIVIRSHKDIENNE